MEGLSDLLPHISGLPWVATFVLILLTLFCSKGIDAAIRWRRNTLELRQYMDGKTKEGYVALIEELKNRIIKLESDIGDVLGELRESRAAHTRCEVEQAAL